MPPRLLLVVILAMMSVTMATLVDDVNHIGGEKVSSHRNGLLTTSVWNHQKAKLRYQSPESGNTGGATPSTLAELDDNSAAWTNDRPLSEIFFFPEACNTMDSLNTSMCCLEYDGRVCGGHPRGACVNVTESICHITEGLFWLSRYFDYVCVCDGNFDGPSCGECKLGWSGDNCDIQNDLLVRRDFNSLSDVDRQYVIDAFRLAKIVPSPYQPSVSVFDYWAVVHHWSLPGGVLYNITTDPDLYLIAEGHVGSAAIPYHRGLVNAIEKALQYALDNSTFALPYWNWTYSEGNDNDPVMLWFGGDGNTFDKGVGVAQTCREPAPDADWMPECNCRLTRGPFASWPLVGRWGYPLNDTIERAFGCHTAWAPSLPYQPAVDCAITNVQFDMPPDGSVYDGPYVFHSLLGGGMTCTMHTWPDAGKESDLHERTHRWLAGTLLGHHPASDPFFWMLHGYADVIYEQWIRNAESLGRFNEANSWSALAAPLGQTRYECAGPFYPLVSLYQWFNDSRSMGFTYDYFNDDPTQPNARPGWSEERWQLDYPTANNTALPDDVNAISTNTTTPSDTSFFTPSTCTNGTCCSYYNDAICGGSERGTCVNVSSVCDTSTEALGIQLTWFTNHYTTVCQCSGNYYGAACESCAAGYEGDDCMTKSTLNQRRDFAALTVAERQHVVDVFRQSKYAASEYQAGVSVFNYYASLYKWTLPGQQATDELPGYVIEAGYTGQGSVSWLRQVLLRFERELQRISGDPVFTIPYWNWAESMGNDNDPVLRYFGGDGLSNSTDGVRRCRTPTMDNRGGCNCSVSRDPVSDWKIVGLWGAETTTIQRTFQCLGTASASLPTLDVVNWLVQLDVFFNMDIDVPSFAQALTGTKYDDMVGTWPKGISGDLLQRVQNWVAGSMTTHDLYEARGDNVNPAADPMWWLAITYGDMLTSLWQQRAAVKGLQSAADHLYTEGALPGLGKNECMGGFFPLTTNAAVLVAPEQLGYTYDRTWNGVTDATAMAEK